MMTGNTVTISPGTMYGTLSKMEKDGLIAFYAEDQKRKLYQITDLGREYLAALDVAWQEFVTQIGMIRNGSVNR